jgi:3-isopropylmalate dehydrogenase
LTSQGTHGKLKITVLAGKGIGLEITREAIKVLKVIEESNDVSFELT